MSIDYNSYLKVCEKAAKDESVFKNFKRHPDYTPILEHVSYQQGLEYLSEIKQNCPNLLKYMDRFLTNDKIGNPNVYYFEDLKINISPTTLRYIKVLSDLINLFGRLDEMNIIEIGGGYGGQCKIINDVYNPASYTLVDLPEVLKLNNKYLKDIENIILRNIDDLSEIHYDLCISNYAFSEVERKYQIFYAEKIIKNSDRGYITCNFIVSENLSKEEIFALKLNYTIYQEKPLTYDGNLIYTWK
jgi:hypothetical protein